MARRSSAKHLEVTAIHEAGHAVAHIAVMPQYHRFDRLFIRSPNMWNVPYRDNRGRSLMVAGMVEGNNIFQAALYSAEKTTIESIEGRTPEIENAIRQSMEAEFIKTWSGPLAEAKHTRRSLIDILYSGGDSDFQFAHDCVSFFADQESDAWSHIWRELERRARKVVNANWLAILAVAEALIEKRRLSYAAVLKICRTHGLRPPTDV